MPPVPSAFLDHLLTVPRGRIVAGNILDGLDEGLFGEDLVREVLDWWHGLFVHRIAGTYGGRLPRRRLEAELMNTLDLLLLEERKPRGFRPGVSKPEFRLRCAREPTKKEADRDFVSVAPAHGFVFHLVSRNERRRLIGKGAIRIEHEPTKGEIDAIVLKGARVVALRHRRTIGRRGGVLWVTPAKDVKKDMVGPGAADRVRDRLGLIHRVAGEALLAVHLPSISIKAEESGRPTFADAAGHARFKTRPDRARNRRRSTWGYTLDLERLAGGERSLDGLPERVVLAIPAGRIGRLQVRPLGHLTLTRGAASAARGVDDHESFAGRLGTRHGGPAGLRGRIGALL